MVNNVEIKALCNENRLKLIQCLAEKNKSVTELIQSCGLAQSAVSQHLVKLKNAGFVEDTKQGREVIYSLKNKKLAEISKLLLNL